MTPLVGPDGQPVGARSISYKEWIGGENAKRYATREQLVAFHNLALREQITPLIRNAIQLYDAQQRTNRWYRRFGRWLRAHLSGQHITSRKQALRVLTAIERQKMELLDDLAPGTLRFPEAEAPRDG